MTSATGSGDKSLYAPSAGGLKYNTGTGLITTLANFSTEGNILVNYGSSVLLYDNDNSNRVSVSAPADLTSNVTFRLPNSNGTAGQLLSSDGSGNLSWTSTLKGYNEGTLFDLGTTGGTIAPNVANGNVQKITLNSALTINAFTSPVAGQSLTLIIYGGTAYTSITSTMKFSGGTKTLTATAGCIDILTVYYDGTNYFASLGKGFA
jgi:hypothetical protein